MTDPVVRRALVIGIGEYPALRVPGLATKVASAVSDAWEFHKWLVDGRRLDQHCDRRLQPDEVLLHLWPAPPEAPEAKPCTAQALRDSVRTLLVEPAKTELFVYFAGHGFSARTQVVGSAVDYLVLQDFTDLAEGGNAVINVAYLVRLLSACGPGTHYYFFDACRNEIIQGGLEGGTLGLSYTQSPAGTPDQFRMFSTRSGAQAAGASVFAQALMQGLRGEGRAKVWRATDDEEPDKLVVRFESVYDFVRAEMERTGSPQLPVPERIGGGSDVIDVLDPPPKLTCEVSCTPHPLVDGTQVTARLRGALAATATVAQGKAVLELPPDSYQIVPLGTQLMFKPTQRKAQLWQPLQLTPPFEAMEVPGGGVGGGVFRGGGGGGVARGGDGGGGPFTMPFLDDASPLDRQVYAALIRDSGLESLSWDSSRTVESIAAAPARLRLALPSGAAALTHRVETLSGRAVARAAPGNGGVFDYQLPPDSYRVRYAEWGFQIRDQEIELQPGQQLQLEPAQDLPRSDLHERILDTCGRDGRALITPEGPILDGDLALWLPLLVHHRGAPPFEGPGDPVFVIASTRAPAATLSVIDAAGHDVPGGITQAFLLGDGVSKVLVVARDDRDRAWLVVGTTGFAIPRSRRRPILLVISDGPDGQPSGSLQQLPPRGWVPAEDRLAEWLAARVSALAQRALRWRQRIDLAALIRGADLEDVASRAPLGMTALRLLALRQDPSLVRRIDQILAGRRAEAPDAVFLDLLTDPTQLQLPPGAQLRWDSPLLSFTSPGEPRRGNQ